jgi:hypothetical protein
MKKLFFLFATLIVLFTTQSCKKGCWEFTAAVGTSNYAGTSLYTNNGIVDIGGNVGTGTTVRYNSCGGNNTLIGLDYSTCTSCSNTTIGNNTVDNSTYVDNTTYVDNSTVIDNSLIIDHGDTLIKVLGAAQPSNDDIGKTIWILDAKPDFSGTGYTKVILKGATITGTNTFNYTGAELPAYIPASAGILRGDISMGFGNFYARYMRITV